MAQLSWWLGCSAIGVLVVGCGEAPEQHESLGEVASAAVVCPDDDELQGIDVSYYQDQPNWTAVAGSGLSFAITRVNHGSFMDPEFDTNWAAIRDVGMIRGAYQYFDPGGDPVAQANVFIDKVGMLGPGDLPGVIDVESTDGQSPATIQANVGIWVDLVEAGTGRKPIIYTGSYFWNDNVGTDMFNDHPLWIAHYTNACPNLPTAWSRWTMWQYTSTGSHPGINGNVDTNVFNGNIEELNDLAGNGYRAEVVSLTYPDTLHPGEVGHVEVVLDNLGARSWGSDVKIGTTMPRDRDSVFFTTDWEAKNRALVLDETVGSGQTVTLTFDVIAPAELGSYQEHFNLVREGVAWFSDTPPAGGPPDDAIRLDIEVVADDGTNPPDDEPIVPGDGGGSIKVVSTVEGEASCAYGPAPAKGSWGWWLVGLFALRGRASRAATRRRSRAARNPRRR